MKVELVQRLSLTLLLEFEGTAHCRVQFLHRSSTDLPREDRGAQRILHGDVGHEPWL